jgi:hypothetical protein
MLQYYEQFLVLSKLMTITGFLTSNERNTAFWCGFHLDDRRVLQPHALDTPLHFEDVFMSARAAFSYKSEPAYMPLLIPTSMPPNSSPIPLAAPPHPSPKRPPEILHPASAPPILQHFNDPGEGDLCPQVDLGTLPGTYHGPCAHGTSPPSPPSPVPFLPSSSPTRPPSPPSSPLLLPPPLEPSPAPQLPVCLSSSSLLSDLLHTPSLSPSVPVLSITSSLSHSHLDKQSIVIPTPRISLSCPPIHCRGRAMYCLPVARPHLHHSHMTHHYPQHSTPRSCPHPGLSIVCLWHLAMSLHLLHFLPHHHLDPPILCQQRQSKPSHHHQRPASHRHSLPSSLTA